jgi:heme A synthase
MEMAMISNRYISTALLLIAQVLIGGWAFMKMLDPDMMLEILRAFTFC